MEVDENTPVGEEPMETGETAPMAPKTPLVFRPEGEILVTLKSRIKNSRCA